MSLPTDFLEDIVAFWSPKELRSQKTPLVYPCIDLSIFEFISLFAAQRQYSRFISTPQ